MRGPIIVLCMYRVSAGSEQQFLHLLERHWPTLDRAGLVTSKRPTVLRATDRHGRVAFLELFRWKDETSAHAAHISSDVSEIWRPIGELTENMEFFEVEEVSIN